MQCSNVSSLLTFVHVSRMLYIICDTWKDRMRGNRANSASHTYTQNTENIKVEKLEQHNVYTGKNVSFDTAILFWLPCTQVACGWLCCMSASTALL